MVDVVGSLDRAVTRDVGAGAPVQPAGEAASAAVGEGARHRHWLARIDWSKAGLVVGLALFLVALLVLYDILSDLTWAEVANAFSRIAWHQVILAFGATALSYAALIGYDVLALRHVGAR